MGLDRFRASGNRFSSHQYAAMVDMIEDLGDKHRHARWRTYDLLDERVVQLLKMLDYVVVKF